MCVACMHESSVPTQKVVARGYDRKCQVFRSIPRTEERKKEILFIGHSLINEFLVDEFMPHGDDIAYVNMGIGGDDTRGMYARREIAFARNPYKIVIEIGVNDLLNSEPLDTIMYYYTLFIQEAVSRKIETIVCSVIPSTPKMCESIHEINQELQQVCKKNDCIFVDLSAMADINNCLMPKYDCGDKIHLSGDGYIFWSKALLPYVNE